MRTTEHAHSGTVSVEHQGRTYTALYQVTDRTITVSTGIALRSAVLAETPIDTQARALLHEMVLEGQAKPGGLPPEEPHLK